MHSDAQACPQTCPASVPFDNPVSSAFSEGAERNSWLGPVPPPAGRDTERHARHPERLFPAHPVIRSILRTEGEPGPLHLTYPSKASWMECDHRRPKHRPEAIRRPARIVAPFFDQFFRAFLPDNWKSPALGADCLRNNIFRRAPGRRVSPANSLTSVDVRREFPVLKCFRRQLTNCSCTGLVCSNDRRQSWQRGLRSPMERRGRWCRRRRRSVIFRKNSDPWRSLSTVPRDALVLASTDCRGSPKTASSGRFRGLLQNP